MMNDDDFRKTRKNVKTSLLLVRVDLGLVAIGVDILATSDL
jgi:hypothetical protein